MSLFVAAIATLTPISMIGFFLSVFGLLTGVMQIMGGLRKSGASEAFESVTGASCALIFGAPVLIIIWVVLGITQRSRIDEAMLREEYSGSDSEEDVE